MPDVALERHELFEGVAYERRQTSVAITLAAPWQVLSSAVLGGGRRHAHSLLHLHVPSTYHCDHPERDLRTAARALALPGPTVGLMTAVNLAETQLLSGLADGAPVRALITVGLANAARPGARAPSEAGTINVVVLVGRRLAEGAAVELAMLVAEAKAARLVEAGVRTSDGRLASGTSTDAVAILWHRAGRQETRHAGSATELGTTVGRMVGAAMDRAIGAGTAPGSDG